MKKTRWRLIGCAALAVMIAAVTGCSGTGSENVTVINPPIREAAGKVELERIDRQEDSYGLAWLSDSEIITTHQPKWMEGELTVHSLVKEKEPDRPLGVRNALTVNPSPDLTRLFISNQMEAGFVNLADGTTTKLDIHEGMTSSLNGNVRGVWVRDQAYVLATGDELVLAESGSGQVTPLVQLKDAQTIVKIDAASRTADPGRFTVYYLDQDHALYALDAAPFQHHGSEGVQAPKLIRGKVEDFSVSPDGSRLAVAEETGDNKNTVLLIPADGKGETTILAEGRLARQISWSPDGSKLAYSLFNLERGGSGLYVMDAKTGHTTLVSLYPNLQSLLLWSPDGRRLMMSQENPEMNLTTVNTKLMTEIYRFK
ncbi:hypothetical protein ACTHPF_03545 [Paenibacillus sp. SAF-054]|uniref:hypothetical protein n=1 Tax=unclassified Paenibacillus TaxID=185978 RepID=UPI003F7D41CD